MQKEFLAEILRLCKAEGIHTAIDTAGGGVGDFSEILELVDLVLLDIKQTNEEAYQKVTGISMERYKNFVDQIKQHPVNLWLRAVVVPGFNDTHDYIQDLWEVAKNLPRVKKIEILPYHTMGVQKYKMLGIPYPLEGVPPMDKKLAAKWQAELNKMLMHEE